MVLDGIEGKQYNRIDNLIFSPDSQHFVYRATDSLTMVVVDGIEGKEYFQTGYIRFSPDSSKVAYTAKENGYVFVVVNGVEQKKYSESQYSIDDWVGFSPDSNHIAYSVRQGNQFFLVIDGVEGNPYDVFYGGVVFSPDSQTIACAGTQIPDFDANGRLPPATTDLVINGQIVKQYRSVFNITFSPDSRRLAYAAYAVPEGRVYALCSAVIDGVEGPHFDTVNNILFSPDSQRVAYRVVAGQQWMVIDGVQGTRYAQIGKLGKNEAWLDTGPTIKQIFSPDSRRYAYVAYEDVNRTVEYPVEGTRQTYKKEETFRRVFVVVDGREWTKYEGLKDNHEIWGVTLTNPQFSPNSRSVAYAVKTGGKWFSVVNDVPGKQYDEIFEDSLVLNNEYLSYFARNGTNIYYVEELLN